MKINILRWINFLIVAIYMIRRFHTLFKKAMKHVQRTRRKTKKSRSSPQFVNSRELESIRSGNSINLHKHLEGEKFSFLCENQRWKDVSLKRKKFV